MAFLVAAALFALPFALFWLWRRLWPGGAEATPGWAIGLILAGAGLTVAGGAWYGLSQAMAPEAVYVPARIGPDGQVLQGHAAAPGDAAGGVAPTAPAPAHPSPVPWDPRRAAEGAGR